MNNTELLRLKKKAKEIRKLTIDQIGYLGVGHIGGSLSIVEVLTLLYYKHMRIDPEKPGKRDRDQLILSKGHAGPALYSILADKGYFPKEWLHTLNRGGTNLPSHCDMVRTPGIDMTTGSLGQGISAAIGKALGNKIDGISSYIYVIIGDGESNEGPTLNSRRLLLLPIIISFRSMVIHTMLWILRILHQNGSVSDGLFRG